VTAFFLLLKTKIYFLFFNNFLKAFVLKVKTVTNTDFTWSTAEKYFLNTKV